MAPLGGKEQSTSKPVRELRPNHVVFAAHAHVRPRLDQAGRVCMHAPVQPDRGNLPPVNNTVQDCGRSSCVHALTHGWLIAHACTCTRRHDRAHVHACVATTAPS